jgi:hypothetical protein
MRRRENGRTLLPELHDRLREGDQLLVCGRTSAPLEHAGRCRTSMR